ncbi:MAG: hypothetical protein A2281_11160 [Bacteroidetes bacterium RIFOXYA12_FULL_38_20]|uniref:Aminopeptidase N n=1 Tax=Candidatus Uhrbacteria bacterium GW2011_GWF2_44_350 TaxID=1619000 RepID=A0A0G1JKL6_9BACT|nr:MAG: Aminopeptidase N [Candidatus Uhrbacteria bacterium GW2011_GWF2_44_350]OFY78674.1 MAG: hypothetical protein A2281_11160 [Bacteroidetes bacterium RIFOXYA12_FULL_38_20]
MKKIIISPLVFFIIVSSYSQVNSEKSLHSDSLDVLNYTIVLDLTNLSSAELKGHTTLQIASKVDNLNLVTLDLLRLNVDSIFFGSDHAPGFSYNDTLINTTTPVLYNTGDIFEMTVYYHGSPYVDSILGGFYFMSGYAFNIGQFLNNRPVCAAKAWFPCVDDLIDRASYEYLITTSKPNIAVCGGNLENTIDNGNGTTTFHWVMNEKIPAYLASVAAGKYAHVSDTYVGIERLIPIDIYTYPEDSLAAFDAFSNIKSIASAYENNFGPYGWNKIGFVETPEGTCEHASNIPYLDYCMNNSIACEEYMAHEFGHHWFGDLITFETDNDFWINEGGATFANYVYKESLYGMEAEKLYIRDMHREVLRLAHIDDGGYFPVYGVPSEALFGKTIYDKGPTVFHTLRNYLGDDLFFDAMKDVFELHGYSDISTVELRDYMSASSGVDLTDFFDAWVFNPGHIHFSIDSFNVLSSSAPYNVEVFMRQKTKGPAGLGNSNRVEVTFMNEQWNEFATTVMFDGETGSQIVEVPFLPKIVVCDKEEKACDATTDFYKTIKTTGLKNFETTYVVIDVTGIIDSAFIRVEHNWVAPDPIDPAIPGLFISDYRYWKIDGILTAGFNARGKFYYNKNSSSAGYLDNTFINNDIDSLVLLYRPGAGNSWEIIDFIRAGSSYTGYLISDTLMFGEYALGIWNWDQWMGAYNFEKKNDFMKVYPNPSSGDFNIEFAGETSGELFIYDLNGRILEKIKVEEGQKHIEWSPDTIEKGTYLVHFNDGKKGFVQKVVVE